MPNPSLPVPTTADGGPMSWAIFQLARTHRAHAAALLRAMDLHPGQELLLMQLFDRDGQTQSELLDAVGLDHSTVSKSLRRMQDAGLLTREPATHDRRVLIVLLTDKGRALRDPIAALWRTLEDASARNLTPEQVRSFVDITATVIEAMPGRAPAGDGGTTTTSALPE